MQSHGNYYNNADSFAMVFDKAWKETVFKNDLTVEERIQQIIDQNKDHPFIKSSPSQAVNVAKFRLRLLNLD